MALAWRDLDPIAVLLVAAAVVIASVRGIKIYIHIRRNGKDE